MSIFSSTAVLTFPRRFEVKVTSTTHSAEQPDVDIVVVGAGMGGIYAMHRFVSDGLTVQGFEGAPDVGGVWYHNRYPGARVDVESYDYCYFFDPELYREWVWTERYPSQPEILAYLNHVADRYDVRRRFAFNTWVSGAQWDPDANLYRVTTDTGSTVTARYLVMTTGQLSKPRKPNFPGLDDFEGEWVQTSNWPDRHVQLEGRRVGIIGTGSSGSQAITAIAPQADHLYVFQRTPNYGIPARNGPLDRERYAAYAETVAEGWAEILDHPAATRVPMHEGMSTEFTPEQQRAHLEARWQLGGQSINATFLDQGRDPAANDLVANFVREKVLEVVKDPDVARKLVPNAYPIGTRRLAVTTDYYETFNRDNVTLVDVRETPIERITPKGILTADGHEYELDLIVFSLGFNAFTGALDNANIRNEEGKQPSDYWKRGPKTYLGLMTRRFPNLFIVTRPGSPSVLANMIVDNVQHIDFIADLVGYMSRHGYSRVEPQDAAQEAWSAHVQEVAPAIRLAADNYMVHVNADDGSRVFIPYAGGFNRYVKAVEKVVSDGYTGFDFSGPQSSGAEAGVRDSTLERA